MTVLNFTCTESNDSFGLSTIIKPPGFLFESLNGMKCSSSFESTYALHVFALEPEPDDRFGRLSVTEGIRCPRRGRHLAESLVCEDRSFVNMSLDELSCFKDRFSG